MGDWQVGDCQLGAGKWVAAVWETEERSIGKWATGKWEAYN